MSSSSTNVNSKGFSFLRQTNFPNVPNAPVDAASTGASTITRAFQIVHNNPPHPQPHFTHSQFSGNQNLSAYNLPDDSAQRPICVQSSVTLDYPRYMDPPEMGVIPIDGYDVSEFGPPNPEKEYDYPLACPACGGQMILRCIVNAPGMITRHFILHGETVHRSFDIARFHAPENEGRVARDIALEDEIPTMLIESKAMDDASIDGTECDFETQNIILEELQKPKTAPKRSSLGVREQAVKPNFRETGFGSDIESLEERIIPETTINTSSAKTVSALKANTDLPVEDPVVIDKLSPSAEPTKSGSPSSPTDVNRTGQEVVRLPQEIRGAFSLNECLHAGDPPLDHVLTFEKWRFRDDWKFGIFIDSSADLGIRKLEIYTPQDGRIYIHVPEDLIIPNVTTCSDLIAFKPEKATGKTFTVRAARYHNPLLAGRTKVRFGRELTTEAMGLSACPSESLDAIVNRGGNIQLWSDITGLIDVPAVEVRKLLAGSIFLPIHLFRIRVSIPLGHSSPISSMGPWKLLRMEAVLETDLKLGDLNIPDFYWPAGTQRWDDLFVKTENKSEFVLFSRSYPDRVIIAPRSYCRIALEDKEKMLTAIVAPRANGMNQWIALMAAPIQIAMEMTNDRLFNFAPKTREHTSPPLSREVIDKVKSLSETLQSRVVSKDHPLPRNEGLELIMGLGGSTSSELEKHRQAVYRSLKRECEKNNVE